MAKPTKEHAMSVAPPSAKEIFFAAVEKPTPAERAAFLDQACAGDVALRQRVEALLKAHDEPGSFLENPPAEEPGDTGEIASGRWVASPSELGAGPPPEGPGTRIGPYKLLQKLGEGGMGAVFMAEQEQPVKRRVALKIIKAGLDSAHVIARFEQERQALALMDHPHIAKVLDAGATASGRLYFVMELVKGVPITKYCDQEHLTPRERLALFLPVCQAVQHAHQKGIIHRDLKPSNVLIALYDGKPVPKVIDFGVAKATGAKLTEKTLFTEVGQIIGTLEYMAPEQAELNNLDIDTRADVYALGVILYELLTGSTPFSRQQLRSVAFTEMLRIIREVEPPRPSTRLSSSEELPSLAAKRKLEPKRLTRLVHGDLDWIVMKCLEKERGRRYETANGLALDVQRYLADEPVLAGPPSAGYRLRKFVRRNKRAVGMSALVLLALLAGMVGTSWGLVEAWRQRDAAEAARNDEAEQRQKAQTAEGLATERLEAVTLQKQRAETAEGLATERLGEVTRQKQRAEEEAAIAKAVNDFLQQDLLGQADIRNQPLQGGAAERNPNITVKELLDRAAKTIEGKFAQQPLTEAAIRLTLGEAYLALGRYAETQSHLERSVRLRAATLGANHSNTVTSKNNLARLYYRQAKYDQAETLYKEVIATRTAQQGANHRDTLTSKNDLALMYRKQRKYDRAEPLFEEVLAARTDQLGPDHPDTLHTKNDLGVLYWDQRQYDRVEPFFKEVLAARAATLGPDHPDTLMSKHNLASLYDGQGKYDQAEPLFKEVIAIRTDKLGGDHPETLMSKHNLGFLYWHQNRYDRTEPLLKEVLDGCMAQLGANHPSTLDSKRNLASLYQAQGKYDRAEPLFYELAASRKQKDGADSPQYASDLASLGLNLLRQQKFADAEPLLRACLDIREKKQPEEWNTFNTKSMLGGSLLGQQKYAAAEPLLVQGYEGLKQREAKIPPQFRTLRLTEALERLVQLYDATGPKAKADEWRKQLEAAKGAKEPTKP
jgi:serine/threonine protein kinase/tetratricopeptide (TPR) repeat protein